jgi:hypothetical protein
MLWDREMVMKKIKPSKRIVRRSRDSETDEVPSLLRERFEAQRKRARKQDAFNAKLVRATLKQLGLDREALEKRADADFARAKSDSKAHLAKMRRTHAAARKKRGKLRARIEQAFTRFAS